MHNIKSIRKDPDIFSKKLTQRNSKVDIKNLLTLDKKNRDLIQRKEKLEHEKKEISKKQDKSQFYALLGGIAHVSRVSNYFRLLIAG